MKAHIFCSDLARARGEPMEGTGAIAERVLLLAWPRGKWRVPRSQSVGMSAELAAAIEDAREKRPYLLLVDRTGGEPAPRLMIFPGSVVLGDSADEAEVIAAIRTWADGEPVTGERDERITIICCTDSRVDACCARFGFATYKALLEQADPKRFNILQSTHIGGCRFASSVAVVGRRERYGRLTRDDVPAFLDAIGAGRPFLPAFKGRADLPEPEQVAELAALRWAARQGQEAGAVTLMPVEREDEQTLCYRAKIAGQSLSIRLEARDFVMHGHCDAVGGPGVLTRRWLVREVRAVTTSG
jgi:hypothetical protein